MIPDALLSCSFLLIGSGTCIYRLMSYSYSNFSQALPQFILASIGITAIGLRSIFGLTYNLFWRHYPIDPVLIEQELLNKKEDENFTDWCLYTIGLGSIVQALYLHYNYFITGTAVIGSLILLEIIICVKNELSKYPEYKDSIDSLLIWTNTNSLIPYLDTKYLTFAWLFITESFGLAMNNNYICMANIPYSLTMIVYRPFALCREWSIRNSINDYMMLTYMLLITEALFQSS